MEAIADLLKAGYEPSDIAPMHIIETAMRHLMRRVVHFELVANNIDRPRADGKYDPRWYTAQGVLTGFNEALSEVMNDLMPCKVNSVMGDVCYMSDRHEGWHADGDGKSWANDGVVMQ